MADVRQRARDLRERRSRARELHAAARDAATNYTGDDIQHSEEFLRLQRASGDLDSIASALELVEAEERYVLSTMAGVEGPIQRETFQNNPSALEELRVRALSSEPIGDIVLGTAIGRDELVAQFNERQNVFAAAGDVTLPSDANRTSVYGLCCRRCCGPCGSRT